MKLLNHSLKFSLKYISLIAMVVLTLLGCKEDGNTPGAGANNTDPVLLEKLFVSVEGQSVVKSIHLHEEEGTSGKAKHAAAPTSVESTINFSGNPGARPSEMIFSGGNAYVRVSNTNTVQMFDIASDGIDHNHAIKVGERPIHMYKDKAEKVWIMNDGPRVPRGVDCIADPNADPGCAPDTVSVINGGEHDIAVPNIRVGSGHHKAAFSYPSKRLFVSNINDGTISVIDNDPTSGTYLETIDLDLTLNGDASIFTGKGPHGIDYASHNAKIYNLNTGEDVNVISVIDPVTLEMTPITKGDGPDQVLAVGRLHTRHAHGDPSDGRFVYILANTTNDQGNTDPADDTTTGWVIVIDTMKAKQGDVNHGIIAKTQIPGMKPARIIFGPHAKRLYIPSGVSDTFNPQIDQLAVIDIDPTSLTFNQLLKKITVGKAGGHGSMAATSGDGHFLFVGNTGETTVSVVDTEALAVVATIDVGGIPSGIGVATLGTHDEGGAGAVEGGHTHG